MKFLFNIFFIFYFLFLVYSFARADGTTQCTPTQTCPAGQTCVSSCKLNNPLGSNISPEQMIGRAINTALGVVGSLSLVMFIYGGFAWMFSGGNSEKANKAKGILIWTTLGMLVIFSSYAAVKFVLENLIGNG